MINFLLIIIAVLCLIIGLLAFRTSSKEKEICKKENDELKKEVQEEKAKADFEEQINTKYVEEKKKNEELLQNSEVPNLSGFNAGIELLRKLAEE